MTSPTLRRLAALLLTGTLAWMPQEVAAKRFGGGSGAVKSAPAPAAPPAAVAAPVKSAPVPHNTPDPPSASPPALLPTAAGVAASVAGAQAVHALTRPEDPDAPPPLPTDQTALVAQVSDAVSPAGGATPTGGATATAGSVTYTLFKYNPSHKRDPFKTPLDAELDAKGQGTLEETDARAMVQREKEPLEAFPIDSLKLVAILTYNAKPMAMVQDPTGKGYTVWTGNFMGDKNGQILRIDNNELELLEDAPTPKDPKATKHTILRLHEEEE